MKINDLQLEPGQQIFRKEVHNALGGQTQSGISPAPQSNLVLIFSDPSSGHQYGYFDGWHSDGFFHYCGEGQKGDQLFQRGNKAILNHKSDGRSLQVFEGTGKGKPVIYIGEFELQDYYYSDAPEIGGGDLRQVIMFRLRPLSSLEQRTISTETIADESSVVEVAVENMNSEKAIYEPAREPIETDRRESKLVQEYVKFELLRGKTLTRFKIHPSGQTKPIFNDLYDKAYNRLIEAKGSVSRESIRMALAQLLDYSRFITPSPQLAILLPTLPRPDLQAFLKCYKVIIIYPKADGFEEV